MKKFFGIVCVLALCMDARQVFAQQFTFEFGFLGGGANLDTKTGNVYHYSEEPKSGSSLFTDNYGVTYEPIAPYLKDRLSFSFRGSYVRGPWTATLDVSSLSIGGVTYGEVTSASPVGDSVYASGVCLWGQCLVPVTNMLTSSQFSPVQYRAWNRLSLDSLRLLGGYGTKVRLLGGVSATRYANRRGEQELQRSFIYDWFGADHNWDNRISLTSNEEAKGTLVGPTVGLGFHVSQRKWAFDGEFTQAVLFGSIRQSGNWVDIDDVHETITNQKGDWVDAGRVIYLHGKFPYVFKERVAIPATTITGKVSYRLTRVFSVGLRGDVSVLYGIPVAPAWNVPGRWSALAGSGWVTKKETLVSHRAGFIVTTSF